MARIVTCLIGFFAVLRFVGRFFRLAAVRRQAVGRAAIDLDHRLGRVVAFGLVFDFLGDQVDTGLAFFDVLTGDRVRPFSLFIGALFGVLFDTAAHDEVFSQRLEHKEDDSADQDQGADDDPDQEQNVGFPAYRAGRLGRHPRDVAVSASWCRVKRLVRIVRLLFCGLAGWHGLTRLAGLAGLTGLAGLAGLRPAAGGSSLWSLTRNAGRCCSPLWLLPAISGLFRLHRLTGLHGLTGSAGLAGLHGLTGLHGLSRSAGLTGLHGLTGSAGLTVLPRLRRGRGRGPGLRRLRLVDTGRRRRVLGGLGGPTWRAPQGNTGLKTTGRRCCGRLATGDRCTRRRP